MRTLLSAILGVLILGYTKVSAQVPNPININLDRLTGPLEFSSSINLLIAISSISLIPFFLISTTCFVRFAIIFGLLRNGLGTAQSPPNIVIVTLSLFLTIFVMSPVWTKVYDTAIQPYNQGQINQEAAYTNGITPFREFMLKFTRQKDLALFVEFSRIPRVNSVDEIPIYVIIPAYMISELQTSFQIGFLLFIPFVVIDLIVSNILLSLGMFMLSPVMISLPFKILLFVLVDGWGLIIRGMLTGLQ